MAKVISINVGLPKELLSKGRSIMTGIVKTPVSGPVQVRTLNLDGDRQADLSVHGGIDKAVYAYPSANYPFWERELGRELSWGTFGENLTVDGLTEDMVSIGDRLGIGTAVFAVSQPRLPCFKLAAKLDRDDIVKRLLDSRRTGFYMRVIQEGTIEAGDAIELLEQEPARITIREITDLYAEKRPSGSSRSRIERALQVDVLAKAWREHFEGVLGRS
jgi:MOSC domain-containing protein YiiM